MRVVAADVSPLHYLFLIDCIDVLPRLYGRVLIPEVVEAELTARAPPKEVAEWMRSRPNWLEIVPPAVRMELPPPRLDTGERAAIELALLSGDTLLLIDDRAGRTVAKQQGVD